MTSPAVDGVASGHFSGGTNPFTLNLTTSNGDDFIAVWVGMERDGSGRNNVSSVTSPGIYFTRRAVVDCADSFGTSGEWWVGYATGSLSAAVISVKLDRGTDDASVIAFGVHGATGFDTDGGLPYDAVGNGITGFSPVTFNTTDADDLLIGVTMAVSSSDAGGAPSGWTQYATDHNNGGSRSSSAGVYYKQVSAAQVSASFAPTSSSGGLHSVTLADAFTSDALTPLVFPEIDGCVAGTFSSTNSGSVSLTTSNGATIVVIVGHETNSGTARTVTGITASGLTFVLRKRETGAGNGTTLEEWTALASGPLTAESITVAMSGNIDDACVIAFGVDLAVQFDSDGSLPYSAHASASASYPSVTYNTAETLDMVLGFAVSDGNVTFGSAPVGWTAINEIRTNGGGRACSLGVYYSLAPIALTSASFAPANPNTLDTCVMVDALTAFGGGGGGGGSGNPVVIVMQ